MKHAFLLIGILIISGVVLTSMTKKSQLCTNAIDEVEVVELSTFTTTVYEVEQLAAGGPSTPTGVVIKGTRTEPPKPNNDGGMNYRCIKSEEICYQCRDCVIVSQSGGGN